jgi:hypothetical protein
MATRSKAPKRQRAVDNHQTANSQQPVESKPTGPEVKDAPASQPTPARDDAPTIHKGVYLSALVYVEGDLPAPEDFTGPATSALKEALGEAFKATPGGLNLTLKKVEVQNDVEQEETEEGKSAGEEKFQF